MSVNLPECPPNLKQIQHYLKTAVEHDARDPVVAYWCRLHALQVGLKLTKKTPEETKLLIALMDWLESEKKVHKDNEAISNEVAAQAHLENYALKLFLYADKQDREQNYGKNVVKAFYTSGMIYDVLTTFGELTEEVVQNRKYSKWKAAYIHNCLKNGETPVPGPMPTDDEDGSTDVAGPSDTNQTTPTTGFQEPDVEPSQPNQPNDNLQPNQNNFGFNLPDPTAAINALPSVPHTPNMHPGGFHAYQPTSITPQVPSQQSLPGDRANMPLPTLVPEQISKAQKYCKWASSALNYDDVKTAVTNLKNALELLQTGRDPA